MLLKATCSPTKCISVQYKGAPPSIIDGIMQLQLDNSTHLGLNHQPRMVTLTLSKAYLVNHIQLEGFPGLCLRPASTDLSSSVSEKDQILVSKSAPSKDQVLFSFVLKVSRGQQDWLTLCDYAKCDCRGIITLDFPTQAVRYAYQNDMKYILTLSTRGHQSQ